MRETSTKVSKRLVAESKLIRKEVPTNDYNGMTDRTQNGQQEIDDPTVSFVFRPHTITLLVTILLYFLYVALYETTLDTDVILNTKMGLLVVLVVFQAVGLLMFQDGPFQRPHPAVWRIVLASGVSYLGFLIFLLFQSVGTARNLVSLYDSALGVQPQDKLYAQDCSLTWDNLLDKMDVFVPCHILGWYVKALILRDYWICWIISILFEVLERSLGFHMPNFAECWWDYLILDILICNGLGIHLGMKTCQYFRVKFYSWNGNPRPTQSFGLFPASWTSFHWASTRSFKNYLVTLLVVVGMLASELNAFYLKRLLWIPTTHSLNAMRLVLHALMGLGACREMYEYFYTSKCKKLGAFAWVTIAIIFTETMICIKFGKNEFPHSPPDSVLKLWSFMATFLVLYPIYQFYLRKRVGFLRKTLKE